MTALGNAAGIVDAHVHFWDPRKLDYPWIRAVSALDRPFLPSDYAAATSGIQLDRMVLVEANPLPQETLREVELFNGIAAADTRVAGIVAYVSMTTPDERDRTLDALTALPRVRGARHNIQGEPRGFCTQSSFIAGVRQVAERGLTFDLCATHDQLSDVLELVRACPDTRFILDHCAKPAIRDRLLDPWRADVARLAECPNVSCKLSGLLTEAGSNWTEADLTPYATHVVEQFGKDRVMYGSDWPVLNLAGNYSRWFEFTRRFTAGWTDAERRWFYRDNAMRAYSLPGTAPNEENSL